MNSSKKKPGALREAEARDGKIVETVLRFHPEAEAVYIFGSLGTGDERPESDADIALLLTPAAAKKTGDPGMIPCRTALEDMLRRDVDLVNLRMVDIVFQHEIIREGRCIFQRNEYTVDLYEMIVMSLYQKLNDERADILHEIHLSGRIVGS